MNKSQLKKYLIEEAEINETRVNNMTAFQLVRSWLRYNGIIGYTDDIITIVEAAYNVKLEQ